MEFPAIGIRPGTPLDTAYDDACKFFAHEGIDVHRLDLLNSLPTFPLYGIAKTYSCHPGDENHVFVVYPGEWNDAAILAMLNHSATLTGGHTHGVHFIVAHPVPDIIAYLCECSPRGWFALDCLTLLQQEGPDVTPQKALRMATLCREKLRQYFGVDTDTADPASIDRLETVVLDLLRRNPRRHLPDTGYAPHAALFFIGCLLGTTMLEVYQKERGTKARWVRDTNDALGAPVVLEVLRNRGLPIIGPYRRAMLLNPIGKAHKLFENGAEDSFNYFFRAMLGHLRE